MSEDKKKYPWIKSIFKKIKKEPIECVYDGPKKIDPPVPEVEAVYAGPEYYENNGKDDPVCEDVYAGPEFFERDPEEIEDAVEEEAELPPEEADTGDSDPEPEEDKAEEPEKTEPKIGKDDMTMMQGVYAGPAVYPNSINNPQQDPRMFMTVYAGPDYWNGPNSSQNGQFIPPQPVQPSQPVDKPLNSGEMKCECCGNVIDPNAPFCKECGTPVKKKESKMVNCPACGVELIPGTKFCHECGMPVNTGE